MVHRLVGRGRHERPLRAVTPQRLLDTRQAGPPVGRLVGSAGLHDRREVGRAGHCHRDRQQPHRDRRGGAGYLTAFPGGSARPLASNLNLTRPGDFVAAAALTRFGPRATLSVMSTVPTDLLIDVAGWFSG